MAQVLLLSDAPDDALPSLELLNHRVRSFPSEASSIVRAPNVDITLIDARKNLAHARSLCQLVKSSMLSPVMVIVSETGLPTLNESWHTDDFLLTDSSPGEIDARIRLAAVEVEDEAPSGEIRAGAISIDETTYMATINGRLLNLTYKEFELLNYLVENGARTVGREELLKTLWRNIDEDQMPNERTIDVHIRRLRSKLGRLANTVRTVRGQGYRFYEHPEVTVWTAPEYSI